VHTYVHKYLHICSLFVNFPYLYKVLDSFSEREMFAMAMRQENNSYNSLECSGLFCNWEHISRSDYGVLSPALLTDPVPKFFVHSSVIMNRHPSLKYFCKCSRHFILNHLFLQRVKYREAGGPITVGNRYHHYCLITNRKCFQIVSRLKGSALCNIKTRFSTKKRNPE
jgi:hypothetical protein